MSINFNRGCDNKLTNHNGSMLRVYPLLMNRCVRLASLNNEFILQAIQDIVAAMVGAKSNVVNNKTK